MGLGLGRPTGRPMLGFIPEDGPVNAGEVPLNFEVLTCRQPLHRVDVLFPPGSTLCSQSVRKSDISIGGAG